MIVLVSFVGLNLVFLFNEEVDCMVVMNLFIFLESIWFTNIGIFGRFM